MTAVYALNRNLYPWLPLTLNSLFTHNPDCKVYVICEDDEIPQVKDKRVTFLNINSYPDFEINPMYKFYVLSKFTFVRLWIAEILEENRVIWLDVDTIITDSLEPLWNIDLGPKVLAGVFDAEPTFSIVPGPYINAGILLMDLDKWRRYGFTKKSQDLLKEKLFSLADQDCINYLFKPYIKYLDLKWNYQLNQPNQTPIKNPIIYHYAAHPKLWENEQIKQWNKYYIKELKDE